MVEYRFWGVRLFKFGKEISFPNLKSREGIVNMEELKGNEKVFAGENLPDLSRINYYLLF